MTTTLADLTSADVGRTLTGCGGGKGELVTAPTGVLHAHLKVRYRDDYGRSYVVAHVLHWWQPVTLS